MYIYFLVNLDKLAKNIKDNKSILKYRILVWTQLIPIWNFIALIIYNIRINNKIRVLEKELNLDRNIIKYPYKILYVLIILIAFFIISFQLNVWISFVLLCLIVISFIDCLERVIQVRKQIENL
ncbi:hypothetical protein D3M61_01130 [Aliarcobacter butzleri]|uniref:hypothetical protein n=1 Tax=Aliarcobacter butzleri TaxID=28197 RepID=UPI00102DF694|nr:hypothetical protein [Aliarcobacter butzleri]RZV15921.1 hypothetical protein D3M61_01130 [Aliarcobacter butzleri]